MMLSALSVATKRRCVMIVYREQLVVAVVHGHTHNWIARSVSFSYDTIRYDVYIFVRSKTVR